MIASRGGGAASCSGCLSAACTEFSPFSHKLNELRNAAADSRVLQFAEARLGAKRRRRWYRERAVG